MIKKFLAITMVLSLCMGIASCSDDDSDESINTDRWNGTYMWLNEETEEFKLVEAIGVDEDSVSFALESSRISEEFEAHIKSKSGRYLVENLGQKTVKITLAANGEFIVIDDMWTDDIALRTENWTGKYYKVTEDTEIPEFGDKAWNGVYVLEETGLEVSVYGIKEGHALFSYTACETFSEEDKDDNKDMEECEEIVYNFRCLEPEPGKAVYTEGERLIILERLSRGKLKVTDLYMNDSENKGISGVYTKKQG